MLVLGVQRGHDAGATVARDGRVLAVAQGECVLNIKHADGLGVIPEAARACLREAMVSPGEVDAVVICDSNRDNIEKHYADLMEQTHSPRLLASLGTVDGLTYIGGDLGIMGLRDEIPVYAICHHAAHAALAVAMSGYEEATALIADGYGVCCGTVGYHYEGGALVRLDDTADCFLGGWRYQLFGSFTKEISKQQTQVYDLAGKIMGLNAYGQVRRDWTDSIKDWFRMDMEEYKTIWQPHNFTWFEDFYEGGLSLNSASVDEQPFRDIVASMQQAFSEVACETVQELVARTGTADVLLCGGCALNVLSNEAVASLPEVNRLFIPPNSGDSGLSMGAALAGCAVLGDVPLHLPHLPLADKRRPYLGLSLVNDLDPYVMEDRYPRLTARPCHAGNPADLGCLMDIIHGGGLLGVARGRGEIGPRALGNRSILADATAPGIKDHINQEVKHREWWRPFAPVCRLEDAPTYFESAQWSPYMLTTAWTREEYVDTLCSVTHHDRSARLQVVARREDNPLLWDLLGEIKHRTGVGVLLNTSFNIGGKPLVGKKSEALDMLRDHNLDAVLFEDTLYRTL